MTKCDHNGTCQNDQHLNPVAEVVCTPTATLPVSEAREVGQRQVHARPDLTEHVSRGDPNPLEEQLPNGMRCHDLEASRGEAVGSVLDEEHGQSVTLPRLTAGAREHRVEVSHTDVGDVGLRAGQDVVVPVSLRAGGHTGEVRPCAGLRERERRDVFRKVKFT